MCERGRSNLQPTEARPAFFHRQQIASFLAMTGDVIDVSYRSETEPRYLFVIARQRGGCEGGVEAICNLQRHDLRFFHRQQIASYLAMTGYVIDVSIGQRRS